MLAEKIRLERPSLKILFMSGYSDEWVDAQDEFAEGCGFLRKPYKPEELARKVYEMIHNGPAVGSVTNPHLVDPVARLETANPAESSSGY